MMNEKNNAMAGQVISCLNDIKKFDNTKKIQLRQKEREKERSS